MQHYVFDHTFPKRDPEHYKVTNWQQRENSNWKKIKN